MLSRKGKKRCPQSDAMEKRMMGRVVDVRRLPRGRTPTWLTRVGYTATLITKEGNFLTEVRDETRCERGVERYGAGGLG